MSATASYWERLGKRLNVNRVSRLNQHYRTIKSSLAPRNAKERAEAEFFTQSFEQNYREAHRLISIRFVFYCLLYATIVVNILQVIPFLHFLVQFIEIGNSLVGTGLAFVVVIVLSAKINSQLQLMNECLAHLVALYQSNPKRDTPRVLKELRRTL